MLSCNFQCCAVFLFLGNTNQLPKSCFGGEMGSFSTALHPTQTPTAICCNSHKTELKGLGEGCCPRSSVLPVLGYYFWKPCFLEACLAQGITPKQKSFRAGIVLGATGIQQDLMLVAPSVVLLFPAAVSGTRDFVVPRLGNFIYFSLPSSFPHSKRIYQ